MMVYSEDSAETVDVDATKAAEAAKMAHAHADNGDGIAGTYRVEVRPGQWERYTVRSHIEVTYDVRSRGDCSAPEEMGDE